MNEYITMCCGLESNVQLWETNHWSKCRGGFYIDPNYSTRSMATDNKSTQIDIVVCIQNIKFVPWTVIPCLYVAWFSNL